MDNYLLEQRYKSALARLVGGFRHFELSNEDPIERKVKWEFQARLLEGYKNEMIARGLLKKRVKSMYIGEGVVQKFGDKKEVLFICELCGRTQFRVIPLKCNNNYRIKCNCGG